MRWNLLVIAGMGFLAVLALLPEEERPTGVRQEEYDRAFNEGYQCATRLAFNAAEARKLGEYYYDLEDQRPAFRWFCDEAAATQRREAAARSAAATEPSPRRVTQLSVDGELRDEFAPRRRAG